MLPIQEDDGSVSSRIFAGSYAAIDKLIDGTPVKVRAIRPDDKPVLIEGMHHLSKQSLYFRFFTPKDKLTDDELGYFTELDFVHHVGLLASVVEDDSERPAGVGRYIMSSSGTEKPVAELAFTVVEEYQGLGIATLLLKHLIQIARSEGIVELTANVMPENVAMLKVLRNSGLPMKRFLNIANVLEISLSLREE